MRMRSNVLTTTQSHVHISIKIVFVIMFILSVFEYTNTDYGNYQLIYETYAPMGVTGIVEKGFLFICRISERAGISFPLFRGVYISIALLFLYMGYTDLEQRNCLPLALYAIYPFALDIVQMRSMMVSALVIYGIRYLKNKKKYGEVKFLGLIIVAATQQLSAVIYAILLLIKLDYGKLRKTIIVLLIVETLFIVLLVPRLAIVNRFLSYKVGNWSLISGYSIYLMLVHFALSAILSFWSININRNEMCSDNTHLFPKMMLIVLLLIPFILINENFSRLYRGISVLVFICAWKPAKKRNMINVKNLVLLVYVSIMFYIYLSPHNWNHWEGVFLPMFESNRFFDAF